MKKDLVLLVPDMNIEKTVCAILKHRRQSLGIRELDFDCLVHYGRDGGVRKSAHTLLQPSINKYSNAIVLLDYEGCGEEDRKTASEVEESITGNLVRSGWDRDNILAVVIKPELEAWAWSSSPWVAGVLGWQNRDIKNLKSRIGEEGFQFNDLDKPERPKEALEWVLRKTGIPRSASVYEDMAQKVGLHSCRDESFLKLKSFLCGRFPRSD